MQLSAQYPNQNLMILRNYVQCCSVYKNQKVSAEAKHKACSCVGYNKWVVLNFKCKRVMQRGLIERTFFSPCLLLWHWFVQSINSKQLHKGCKNIYKVEKNDYNLDLKSFKNVQFLVWHAHTCSPTHRKKKQKKNLPAWAQSSLLYLIQTYLSDKIWFC